jgi:cell wall-associated NlpC family hydrolase
MFRLPPTAWPLVLLIVASGAAGCASAPGGRPEAFPRTGVPRPVSPASAGPDEAGRAAAILPWLETALRQRGVRYQLGGASPAAGFDCSGLVQYTFAEHGIALPRTTAEQFARGTVVTRPDVAPGDLVFFATSGPGPTHVGIVTSDATFVHAPDAGGVVRVERFDTRYWATRFIGARRIAAAPGASPGP